MTDDEISQRDKRRQQFEQTKPKSSINMGGLKQWAWPIGIFLVIGGIVTAMVVTESTADECPGHWHSAYTVYIDGDRVPFQNSQFTKADNTWAPGTHIHADDGVYHFHPAIEKCTPMEDAMRNLGVTIGSDSLTLDDKHGVRAGTYDSAPVRVFFQEWSEQDNTWNEVTNYGKLLEKQPANADGFVFLYGTYTDDEVQSLLDAATSIEGNTSYDPYLTA